MTDRDSGYPIDSREARRRPIDDYDYGEAPRRRGRSRFGLGFKIGVSVTGAVVLLAGGALGGFYFRDKFLNFGGTTETKPILVSSKDMHPVDKETYYEGKVVVIEEAKYNRLGGIGKFIPGVDSSVTIVASATCHAGIDNKKFEPQYQIDGRQVTATLGQAEILDCGGSESGGADVKYVRGEGLMQVPEETRNELHARAMEEIFQQARRDALSDKAQIEAAIREELKLRKLGFENINIKFNKPLPPEQGGQPAKPAASPATR